MIYGYARVSTKDQKLDLQIDALRKWGVDQVFSEKASGAKRDRPELEKMIAKLEEGDKVVIWKLDRLGRSTKHLIELAESFREKGVDFVSIKDNIDTTTASGRLMFGMLAVLSEFERDLRSERTHAGLEAARARGRVGGRPKGISDEAKTKAIAAAALYRQQVPIPQILYQIGIGSKTTLYKYLKLQGVEVGK